MLFVKIILVILFVLSTFGFIIPIVQTFRIDLTVRKKYPELKLSYYNEITKNKKYVFSRPIIPQDPSIEDLKALRQFYFTWIRMFMLLCSITGIIVVYFY